MNATSGSELAHQHLAASFRQLIQLLQMTSAGAVAVIEQCGQKVGNHPLCNS